MSLLKAYSLDLKKEINAKDADIFYQKGLISSQKNFRCPNKSCGIAITCANLEKPISKRKIDPYFKSVEDHKIDCYIAEEEKKANKYRYGHALYENIDSGNILINLADPTVKKKVTETNQDESSLSKPSSKITRNISSKKDKNKINHTKTLSVLISSFLNKENFLVSLPNPYPEEKLLQEIFIYLDGQDLSFFEQNCWRIYYGKAWVNKQGNGSYQIKFNSKLTAPNLKEGVRPSFFISEKLIYNSPYKKFKKENLDKIANKTQPRQVFIFSDVPSLSHSKKHINFMLEGLPYLEIL